LQRETGLVIAPNDRRAIEKRMHQLVLACSVGRLIGVKADGAATF
jgi:hypothetical protein